MAFGQSLGNGTRSTNSTAKPSEGFKIIIEKLLISERQQHTTAIVITSAFSLVASLLMIVSICYDAYSSKCWDLGGSRKRRINLFKLVHPAEVFPLILAVAALIQTIVFMTVQSGALTSFWVSGCRLTSELIWPTTWLVALVILVFSLEITFRSLRKTRFRPRGKWDTSVYIGLIVVLFIGLWLASFLMPSHDVCPDFLIWWTEHYAKPAIVLAGGIMLTHIISAVVLIAQLLKTTKMDRAERIAASRIVYSLAINIVILSFVVPFWVERATKHLEKSATKIADITITLSGLLHAVLHVVLRANSERLAIRARQTPWTKKRKIRLFGPNDLNIGAFISTPLLAERSFEKSSQSQLETGLGLINVVPNPKSPRPQYATQMLEDPSENEPLPLAKPQTAAQKRSQTKSSYSIFPTRASTHPGLASWASDNIVDGIQLPAPLFSRRHHREVSTQSGETVEIGLRISHAGPEMLSPESLHLPIQPAQGENKQQQEPPPRPERPDRRDSLKPLKPPSSFVTRASFGKRIRSKDVSTSRPPMVDRAQSKSRWPARDSVITRQQQQRKRQMMKSLPPVPFDTGPSGALFPALRSNLPTVAAQSLVQSARSVGIADSPTYKEPPYRSPTGNQWPLPAKSDNWI